VERIRLLFAYRGRGKVGPRRSSRHGVRSCVDFTSTTCHETSAGGTREAAIPSYGERAACDISDSWVARGRLGDRIIAKTRGNPCVKGYPMDGGLKATRASRTGTRALLPGITSAALTWGGPDLTAPVGGTLDRA